VLLSGRCALVYVVEEVRPLLVERAFSNDISHFLNVTFSDCFHNAASNVAVKAKGRKQTVCYKLRNVSTLPQ